MSFIELFVENLFKIFACDSLGIADPSMSTSSFVTYASANISGSAAIESIMDGDDQYKTLGTTVLTYSSAIISAASNAIDDYEAQKEVELTKAYIESLSEEELCSLIDSLDDLEVKLESSNEEPLKRV